MFCKLITNYTEGEVKQSSIYGFSYPKAKQINLCLGEKQICENKSISSIQGRCAFSHFNN